MKPKTNFWGIYYMNLSAGKVGGKAAEHGIFTQVFSYNLQPYLLQSLAFCGAIKEKFPRVLMTHISQVYLLLLEEEITG